MANGDSDQSSTGADASPAPLHVTSVLVASIRAMSNALDTLGFPEEDDRVVDQDGRLGFVTCSHEADCDDMFALIAELSSAGETWEIQFQTDLAPEKLLSLTLSRHRAIVAHEQELPAEQADSGTKGPQLPIYDLDDGVGQVQFQRAVRGAKPSEIFAEIVAGPDGRARARIVQRAPRRVLAEAAAADEPALRAALREAIPKLMFTVGRRGPA